MIVTGLVYCFVTVQCSAVQYSTAVECSGIGANVRTLLTALLHTGFCGTFEKLFV